MELTYNGTALHTLAQIEHGGFEYQPNPDPDQPHRWRTVWKVTLHFVGDSWDQNRERMATALAACKVAHGVLMWKNDAGAVLLHRTATVESPQEGSATGGGVRHQSVGLSFVWWDHDLATTNRLTASWIRPGQTPQVLGHVYRFSDSYSADRVDPLRSARLRAGGVVSMAGQFLADTAQSIANRRDELQSLRDLWMEEVNHPSGRLVYGTFDRVVRVTRFTAEVNDAATAIEWSLEAEFTRFPDEEAYTIIEYEAKQTVNREERTTRLSLSGYVGAASPTVALAQLETVIGSVRSGYSLGGYTLIEMSRDTSVRHVQADTDGSVFTRLNFTLEYQVSRDAVIAERRMEIQDEDDPAGSVITRRYSGTVAAASDVDRDTAYAAAWAEVMSMAQAKHAVFLGGSVNVQDATQKGEPSGLGPHWVRVQFDFRYHLKSGRVFCELTSSRRVETFGDGREELSGHIVASSAAQATTLWQTIRNWFLGSVYLIESEEFNETRAKHSRVAAVGPATVPPGLPGGSTVNQWESDDSSPDAVTDSRITGRPYFGSGYASHWKRFEFRIAVFTARPAGTGSVRYTTAIGINYLTLERTVTVSGRVWTFSPQDAETVIGLLSLSGYGERVSKNRESERVKDYRSLAGSTDDRPPAYLDSGAPGYLVVTQFSETFTGSVTGEAGLRECSASEEIECSGQRLVVHPTAFGRDVVQACGYASGRRTVRAMAAAASETAAWNWVVTVLNNLKFPSGVAPSNRYMERPRISVEPNWGPLTDGTWRSGGELNTNARLFKVSGERSEVLPHYDWDPEP